MNTLNRLHDLRIQSQDLRRSVTDKAWQLAVHLATCETELTEAIAFLNQCEAAAAAPVYVCSACDAEYAGPQAMCGVCGCRLVSKSPAVITPDKNQNAL